MNIIELIKDQISGEVLKKLSSLLGVEPDTLSKLLAGGVPALLAALSGLASAPGGADKMISALKSTQPGSLDDVIDSCARATPPRSRRRGVACSARSSGAAPSRP